MKSLNIKTKELIKRLFNLERCGRYEEAIQELGDLWLDKNEFPNVESFNRRDSAEIILRCGSLIGLLGHIKQIPNSQERSKDLLTEAHRMFLEIYDIEKIAECESQLALCYWRKGELVEASVWLEQSFCHNLPNSCDARLFSHLVKSMLTNGDKKYWKTILNFKCVERDFRKYGDDFLNGTISSNIGIAYKNLGDFSEALRYFDLARYYHKKSQHQIYLATIENNISLIYKSSQDFLEAHEAIDNAISIFKTINDKTRYGFSFDTKALIYLEEGKFKQALITVDEGLEILEKGENINYLVETLSTKVKVLVKLNRIAEASLCLSEAVSVARVQISEVKAKKIAEDFARSINEEKSPHIINVYSEKEFAEENIKLVLPPSLSHYDEIEGVWIRNKYLESVGLKKGSLAIIVKEEVKRGDLVAILERDSEDVSCGFYDSDFGIISLQRESGEPQLFSENEIQILGKIIGVADPQEEDDGKMFVEPITTSYP